MNKSSERIAVSVTPAQKRAITTKAQSLGISVSELLRRAVLAFEATGEQVRVASIVDRMRAPQTPDALNETLRRVALAAQAPLPSLLQAASQASPASSVAEPEAEADAEQEASLGASVMRAIAVAEAIAQDPAHYDQEAVARVTARRAAARLRAARTAKEAANDATKPATIEVHGPAAPAPGKTRPRLCVEADHGDDTESESPTEANGRFA